MGAGFLVCSLKPVSEITRQLCGCDELRSSLFGLAQIHINLTVNSRAQTNKHQTSSDKQDNFSPELKSDLKGS